MNEHSDKLRAPFPTNTIKVKPQSVHEDAGLVTFYVDARIVAERLNEVVGAEKWSDNYHVITTDPAAGLPVECRLTVEGVMKCDVGQIAPGPIDDKAWKSSYSDAFKRAAVKFGVGAYLYESPNIWAEVKIGRNGKAQGFSEAGRAKALAEYAKWIGDSAPSMGATSSPPAARETGAAGNGTDGTAPEPAAPVFVPPTPTAHVPEGWTWPSGKHAGKSLDDTELDYVVWYSEKGPRQDVRERCLAFLGGSISDDSIPF